MGRRSGEDVTREIGRVSETVRRLRWESPRNGVRWELSEGDQLVGWLRQVVTSLTAEGMVDGAPWQLSRSASNRRLSAESVHGEVAHATVGWIRGGPVVAADETAFRLDRRWGRWWRLWSTDEDLAIQQGRPIIHPTIDVAVEEDVLDRHPEVVLLMLYAQVTRDRSLLLFPF